MSLRTLVYAASLMLLFAPASAEAQRVASLAPGERVRVTIPDSLRQAPLLRRTRSLIGTVARATNDTMYLQFGTPDTLRIPVPMLRYLEVSEGASRVRSAASQALAFGVALAVVGSQSAEAAQERRDRALVFGFSGFALGAVIGAVSPYERWHAVRRR